jgi:S-adenosylmethionine:tRNA ribosyltransferase-isomerase
VAIDPSLRTSDFFYDLPESAIAQEPIEPRDAARLLDTRDMRDHHFSDLPTLLDPGDLVVVNRTKVRAARIHGLREGTGGKVELLVLGALEDGTWECLARPARRLRPGVTIEVAEGRAVVTSDPAEGRVRVRFEVEGSLEAWFERVGEVPLPPYFHGTLESPDRYQTLFAERVGSAAAPTAALHFTPRVVTALAERDIGLTEVELVVGLDTFRPIQADRIADHTMHSERYVVPLAAAEAVAETRARGGRVVAVGTTVTRTLEATSCGGGRVAAGEGATDLFITPGREWQVVDLLITNFHVPGSTLIVLVASLLGDRWREVYQEALARGLRFLSFGDAMLAATGRHQ